jgi:hypothetical protein
MIMMSLNVNKDHSMLQENDELLLLVKKYHILVQLRILLLFSIHTSRGILFLSISINLNILEQSQTYNLYLRNTTI